jgi:hypothetical protein
MAKNSLRKHRPSFEFYNLSEAVMAKNSLRKHRYDKGNHGNLSEEITISYCCEEGKRQERARRPEPEWAIPAGQGGTGHGRRKEEQGKEEQGKEKWSMQFTKQLIKWIYGKIGRFRHNSAE